MDQTSQLAREFAETRAAITPRALDEKRAAGAADARAAIELNQAVFVLDENGLDELGNAYAAGWNSAWATSKKSYV